MAFYEVNSPDAPEAIGPYSQAVIHNGLIFCSGQIPIDPQSGKIVSSGIEAETHQVLKNLSAVLKAAGSDLSAVIKTTIYLQDMENFSKVNQVYASYFKSPFPARATVQVARLPRDVGVEIDAIAHSL